METAGDKPEEGGDDVKSSWPLRVGLHTCYNGKYRGSLKRELELIPENFS
jgi:rRNA maturation protein Nop10